MEGKDVGGRGPTLSDKVEEACAAELSSVAVVFAAWRQEHPRATLDDIEDAFVVEAAVLSEKRGRAPVS